MYVLPVYCSCKCKLIQNTSETNTRDWSTWVTDVFEFDVNIPITAVSVSTPALPAQLRTGLGNIVCNKCK